MLIIPPDFPSCPRCDAPTYWGVCKDCGTPDDLRTVAAHFHAIEIDPTEPLEVRFEAGNLDFSWAREAYYREQEALANEAAKAARETPLSDSVETLA